ncbi:hypothetical protein DPMN_188051 [Dreissena polymorpha]|uniref:C-type lectin domain-containing protein n=1 Tax=Dreissena polymorpha TaxID=45954 RepID=A0A9D4I9L0_DREPO|nr:hypothetical protein DPMN_188051 [Dreissena polymorpha]
MNQENFIAALFILQDGTRDLSRCPSSVPRDGYLFVQEERCYQFVIFQEKYWVDARNDCNNKGGSLVIIKDQQTQQFIMASLGYLGNSKQGIWIGLSDSRKELQWEWVNADTATGRARKAGPMGCT